MKKKNDAPYTVYCNLLSPFSPEISTKEKAVDSVKQKKKSFPCPSCKVCFSTSATLRKHEQEKHAKISEPIFMVDNAKGIFITAKDKSGPRSIVHICKSFSNQVIDCEAAGCREFMTMATGRECFHLERVKHFKPHEPPPLLKTPSIWEMFDKGLISGSARDECTRLNDKAKQEGTVGVFPVFYDEHGYSGLRVNFSVYTGKIDGWCTFGRTRVTLDTRTGKWTCRCRCTNKRSCIHILLSMCWTYQERRHLLQESEKDMGCSSDTDDDLYGEDMEPSKGRKRQEHISSVQIQKMVEYMWRTKRIPPTLPEELKSTAPIVPERFTPEETKCPYCPGPTPPDLSEEKLVTKKGTIYGILAVHKGLPA